VKAFLDRPIEGDWPYLWIDATNLKVRRGGRIVSVAAIIAVGVNSDGRREVLGMEIGTSEAEPIWTEFPRSGLDERMLRHPASHIVPGADHEYVHVADVGEWAVAGFRRHHDRICMTDVRGWVFCRLAMELFQRAKSLS